MELLQARGHQWRDLKRSIATGTLAAGTYMVLGSSDEITVQAQTILEDAFQREYPVKYFLASGSGIFRIPCFLSFTKKEDKPEPLHATHFLTGEAFTRESYVKRALNEAVEGLEQMALRGSSPPQLILVEYLTPPTWLDLSFTVSLLRSEIPQNIPVVLLVHQSSASDSLAWQDYEMSASMLLTLYLCGGRMDQAVWQKIRDQLPGHSNCDRFIASRRVGSDMWISYANRQVAEMAEMAFQTWESGRKYELARSLLHTLPHSTGYPLLAIASETDDLATMLSIYSQAAVNTMLPEPKGLVRYFDHLRQAAQKAGDAPVTSMAHICYLSSQFLLDGEHSLQIYKRLQEIGLPDCIDRETEGFFWNTLGQQLVKMKYSEAWEYAEVCFRRSRKSFQCIESEHRSSIHMGLALIANGEALVAYKRRQGEVARQLEEIALEKSKDLTLAPNFQVHVRINLGDVFLHSLGDMDAALVRYGEALLVVSQIRKKFGFQVMPRQLAALRQQAALKLGSTFVQAGRYTEAITFLEYFLSSCKKEVGASGLGEESRTLECKTRLALAQAYLNTGQRRKAAASYWYILRHPQWLGPVTLKEVIAKLADFRPAIPECLQRRMEHLVSEQEAILADTIKVREVLTGMKKWDPPCF